MSLMDAGLFYEEIAPPKEVTYTPMPLINDRLMCEADNCDRPATAEYTAADEDRNVYYTYRCTMHPAPREFLRRPLR